MAGGRRRLQRLLGEVRRSVSDLRHPVWARDRLDNEHLELLLALGLRSDSSCVDVGANRGAVLAGMVRHAARGRHIAYEPLPHLAAALAQAFPEVDVRDAAVGADEGERSFVHVVDDPALSGLQERTYPGPVVTEEIRVRVVRLDDDLPARFAPSLIKIDVEGGELGVLQGALNTIKHHQPIVVFEHGVDGASHYGTRPTDVFDLLHGEAGLLIYDLDGNGPYDLDDFGDAATGRRGGRWNWVARP